MDQGALRTAGAVAADNEEARDAWNGVLYDRFTQFREVVVSTLGAHGTEALRLFPPRPGERVLDIGCGNGDTTQAIAELVGPEGSALGVDVAERFIDTARAESAEAGVENVSFEVADVQTAQFEPVHEMAFSRFGTMFFANPVAALRNVRGGLKPGGRLCMVVWRQKPDNEWLHRAELAVARFLPEPDHDATDEPTCGPGPFSMAGADVTSGILVGAGFDEIALRRCDLELSIGATLEDAVALLTAIGPAGEVIRLSGDDAERIRPELESAIAEALVDYVTDEGVVASSSTWIVTARNPG